MEVYQINDVCFFNKVKEQWGALSNMSNQYGVKVAGLLLRNTEALYQALRFPYEPDIQFEIITKPSGMGSKMTSKKYRKLHTRDDWNEVQVDIMKYCVELKMYQHYNQIKRILDQTEDKPIVELSHKDQFWGTIKKDGMLVGQNVLGKIWMDIRNKPMNKPVYHVNDMLLMGQCI